MAFKGQAAEAGRKGGVDVGVTGRQGQAEVLKRPQCIFFGFLMAAKGLQKRSDNCLIGLLAAQM